MKEITITDSSGTKKTFEGIVGGFVLKKASNTKKGKACKVCGLDDSWAEKKILCIIVDEEPKTIENHVQ